MDKNNHQVMRMIFLISQIGITALTTIFLCMGIGYLIDHNFHTHTMVWFIILGVLASFKSTYMLIKKFIGREDE